MINCGHVILTMACALILTFTKSHILEIITLMIVAGAGAGQVESNYISYLEGI